MPYFKICPTCGAHLDPGETCDDCRTEKVQTNRTLPDNFKEHPLTNPSHHSSSVICHGLYQPARERSIS